MDNSDDYFGEDDLLLDEATEAALVESERKYATQTQPHAHHLPVTKKLKTASGWSATRADSLAEFDLPEITVQENGYAVSAVSPQTSFSPVLDDQEVVINRPQLDLQWTTNFARANQGSAGPTHSSRGPAINAARNVQRSIPAQVQRQHVAPNVYRRASPVQVSRSNSINSANKPSGPLYLNPLEDQMRLLQQQLEELRQANNMIQTSLNEALEGKMAKDGEVTILRKTIEKNAINHAAEVARLKAAKEEADTKQLQMQKLMKEDMERLKTQFTFKQQELETSLRKPPQSVRAKKMLREPPSTPLPGPSYGGNWNIVSQRPNFNADVQQTPVKRNGPPKFLSPKKPPKSPEKMKKPMLPGFQNAFVTSTPSRPVKVKNKGKEEPLDNIFNAPRPSDPFSQSFPSIPFQEQSQIVPLPPPSPLPLPAVLPQAVEDAEPAGSQPFTEDGDILMDSEESSISEECEVLNPINWKAELSRIILTHIRPRAGRLTFQQLLGASISDQGDIAATRRYTNAYTAIMDCISNSTKMDDYEQTLNIISDAFISMIQVLSEGSLTSPLTSLFNLLAVIAFYIPKFRTHLILQSDPGQIGVSRISTNILYLLKTHLIPTDANPDREALGTEFLSFLEALYFDLSDNETLKFLDLLQSRDCMMVLLNPSQSPAFLTQASHILALLSTYRPLYRSLLSIPDTDREGQAEAAAPKNGVIERLCSYLVDSSREGPEYREFKEYILTFFAQLSLSHPDAHALLTGSPIFLASLVFHIAQLTTPLWEDDENLIESPDASLSLIKYINQCVYLVHHFVFSTDSAVNLRHRLQHAPQRPFNSVLQMFIVAFGRLSYADPPEWVGETGRNMLEQLTEMAREILELVVDGPEGDGVWNAYQEDLDEDNLMDEEEMEAELME